jgi:hypothetical protein
MRPFRRQGQQVDQTADREQRRPMSKLKMHCEAGHRPDHRTFWRSTTVTSQPRPAK